MSDNFTVPPESEDIVDSLKNECTYLKTQSAASECTFDEMAVLRAISEFNEDTQENISLKTGISVSTIKKCTKSLQNKGLLKRINGRRYGKWEILTDIKTIIE